MSTVIEQPVQTRLVAAAPQMSRITATLRYDPCDPFAVRMTFPAPATLDGVEVCWTFARELLTAGLDQPEGDGDVRVRPYGSGRTVMEFRAPEGTAVVHVDTGELRLFVRATNALVPAGREHLRLDLDEDLARLMGDDGQQDHTS
ncbi:SsgA family sporulation/cell division regulator [Streptomyces sp. LPB2020-019-1HS]|uniref:SsgA family sporulation/cell division regulator n=1 Tax=Streptomyces sp. LPB2020-019-1HS TaxID=3409689 RepID=UPI003B685504